jgi:hypothetical protein
MAMQIIIEAIMVPSSNAMINYTPFDTLEI